MNAEFNITMLVLALCIVLAQVGLLLVVGWLANRFHDARNSLPAPELRFVEPLYTPLSKAEMRMLLEEACADAVRRLREDGTGIVRASVLGYSWQVDRQQMSTFLAWVRGRTVERAGVLWVASVEPQPHLGTAWIIFRRVGDSINVREQLLCRFEDEVVLRDLAAKGGFSNWRAQS